MRARASRVSFRRHILFYSAVIQAHQRCLCSIVENLGYRSYLEPVGRQPTQRRAEEATDQGVEARAMGDDQDRFTLMLLLQPIDIPPSTFDQSAGTLLPAPTLSVT